MNKVNIKKIALSGMLIALAVVLSTFSIPVGASKCFPIQHLVNVVAAVFLGPWYGVAIAFCTSLIRNMLGTGSLLAFPGSMVGALLCGLCFKLTKKYIPTYLSEIIGTGIIGGMLSWPVATLLMGNKEAALFTYVIPFLVSTIGGTLIAAVFITIMEKTGALKYIKSNLDRNEHKSRKTNGATA